MPPTSATMNVMIKAAEKAALEAYKKVAEQHPGTGAAILARLGLEARSADAFIADMISLDTEKATTAIKTMRQRFKLPQKTADELLTDMQEAGLHHTVEALRAHLPFL